MKQVIILGTGGSSIKCPFDTEVWGVNAAIHWTPEYPIHRLFFFDDLRFFPKDRLTLADLKKFKGSTMTTEKNKKYAAQHGINLGLYPLNKVTKQFGTDYFNNSITYMIALAMYERYEKLSLWGVDHMEKEELGQARSGVEYWLGRAEQAGIKVDISVGSELLTTHNNKIYGYEYSRGGK